MTFKLHYLSRARLWSEVVVTSGERVFVPSTETPATGSAVQVDIDVHGLTTPLQVTGTVLQLRPLSATQPAGLVLQLDTASVERCRALVAEYDEAARTLGRQEVRADCDLPARVLRPVPMSGCAIKSLSVHGLTLKSSMPVEKSASLVISFQLSDGSEVLVSGHVMWSRPELMLSGLRLDRLETTTEKRLENTVDVLMGKKEADRSSLARVVLIADDDPSILDFTSKVVTMAGHRVLRADRGDEALELIRRERPDLVFLDVLMPGLDGLQVCKALRLDAGLQRTPVILLSAMGEDRLGEAAKSSGADGFLTKPMRLEALRAVLSEKLGRR